MRSKEPSNEPLLVMFRDLNYPRLKRSFVYLVEHYMPAAASDSEADPVKFLERLEASSMSQARRSLAIRIADVIESTEDFCGERVGEIDRDLERRDAYTLSFLREHFSASE